ncbi:MAG: hypothetical protein ACFFG0_19945 [Candidatus Thorarchaeota archaeon]
MLIISYKILKESLNVIKSNKYSAVRMHPNVKKIAPMHIFTEFFMVVSLFLKYEKKTKKGISAVMIKINIKSMTEISNINKMKIIGKSMIPA